MNKAWLSTRSLCVDRDHMVYNTWKYGWEFIDTLSWVLFTVLISLFSHGITKHNLLGHLFSSWSGSHCLGSAYVAGSRVLGMCFHSSSYLVQHSYSCNECIGNLFGSQCGLLWFEEWIKNATLYEWTLGQKDPMKLYSDTICVQVLYDSIYSDGVWIAISLKYSIYRCSVLCLRWMAHWLPQYCPVLSSHYNHIGTSMSAYQPKICS